MVNLREVVLEGWGVCLTRFESMQDFGGEATLGCIWNIGNHFGQSLLGLDCWMWNVQNDGIFSVLPHSYRGVISSVFWIALHILLDNLVLESFIILPSCSLQQKYIMWFWEIYFVIKTNTFFEIWEIHFRVCNYFWKILESFIIPPSCSLQRKFSNE